MEIIKALPALIIFLGIMFLFMKMKKDASKKTKDEFEQIATSLKYSPIKNEVTLNNLAKELEKLYFINANSASTPIEGLFSKENISLVNYYHSMGNASGTGSFVNTYIIFKAKINSEANHITYFYKSLNDKVNKNIKGFKEYEGDSFNVHKNYSIYYKEDADLQVINQHIIDLVNKFTKNDVFPRVEIIGNTLYVSTIYNSSDDLSKLQNLETLAINIKKHL